jgi:hypothetical protein
MPYVSPIYLSNSPSVPRSITKMARERHLGRQCAIYKYRIDTQSIITIVLFLPLMGGILLYLSILILSQQYPDLTPDKGVTIAAYVLLLMAILLLSFLGLGVYRLYEKSFMAGLFISTTTAVLSRNAKRPRNLFPGTRSKLFGWHLLIGVGTISLLARTVRSSAKMATRSRSRGMEATWIRSRRLSMSISVSAY